MPSHNKHVGQHEVNVPKGSKRAMNRQNPVKGLLVMLGSCVAFLAFLVLLTVVVHFVML